MRFTQRDFEGLLDFVQDLHDHCGLHDFAHRTAACLVNVIDAEHVIHGDFDVERQSARLSMHPAMMKEHDGTVDGALHGDLSGLERRFAEHPLYRCFLQTGDGHAQKMSQVTTPAQLQHYRRSDPFARRFGARFQMAVFFSAGPALVSTLLLVHSQRDFTERQRALLNRLYPHLVQAFRNAASLNRLYQDVDGLVEMLEGPTSSVVVLSGGGDVKRWTTQAKSWIAAYCRTPFPAQSNRLPQCFADWYRRQLALAAHETLRPSPREPLVVSRNGRQLTVQFIPDHLRDEHLLLLNEKSSQGPLEPLEECGLTPRESEVLAWVAKGKTNAEVGMILQLSGRTVQKHLEHIYSKLGVETRTTATVRALQMRGVHRL
jgi:DNA-binding CsgD family transcriptional regulator